MIYTPSRRTWCTLTLAGTVHGLAEAFALIAVVAFVAVIALALT
jgi:hypothetical protein